MNVDNDLFVSSVLFTLDVISHNGVFFFLLEQELVRKEISKRRAAGFSLMYVVVVGLISLLLGYIVKRT